MIPDINEIDDAVDQAYERIIGMRQDVDRLVPKGKQSRMDERTLALLVQQKLQEFPPVPIQTPTGQTIVASPFLAALAEVEGGKAVLKRIQRIMGGA